jgi:malonyl-CoA O-methyltransferase
MIELSQKKYPQSQIKFMHADAEKMPFGENAFNLVVSNASLQWMDINKVINEVARVLRPKGEFHFTTFGPQTLCELRRAGLSVNPFPGQPEIEALLAKLFGKVQITSELVQQGHKDIYAFFSHLRRIGAQNPRRIINKGLLTPKKLIRHFPLDKGFETTYEIYYARCQRKVSYK